MKYLNFFILIIAIISMCSCEVIEDITGDSGLRIVNDCDDEIRVYFDDDYIGQVDAESSKTWDVPSGQHKIKATAPFSTPYEETHSFISGEIVIIELETVGKYGNQPVLNTI
ncbi:MAG: hypothetical protein HQ541_07280 [Mariniphaga sp.]|nr:hypothetical protein [Mariniphaga sp.]